MREYDTYLRSTQGVLINWRHSHNSGNPCGQSRARDTRWSLPREWDPRFRGDDITRGGYDKRGGNDKERGQGWQNLCPKWIIPL